MKILYVSLRPPYPPYKGDQLIAYNQLKRLKKNFKVNLVTFVNKKDKDNVLKNLNSYCENIFLLDRNKINKLNVVKSLFNLKPFQVNLFKNKQIDNEIKNIISEVKPDLIHVQTIRLADYFYDVNLPKILDMIDAISLNMKRRAKRENLFLKLIFYLEGYLCQNYEHKLLEEYNNIILVSKKEKEYFNNNKKITVNPNGTYITKDLINKYKHVKQEKALIFHGNMQYFPNVEAVVFFVKNIFPKLKTKFKDLKFYIVGKDPNKKVKSLHDGKNVIVTGFVDDICEYLSKCLIGVYPLNSGSGMQNKILEALACGLPSVVSPHAIQGIEGINSSHVYIAENVDKFIDGVITLLEDDNKRKEIAKNGQEFIFENYSWESNVNRLIKVWEEALDKNSL